MPTDVFEPSRFSLVPPQNVCLRVRTGGFGQGLRQEGRAKKKHDRFGCKRHEMSVSLSRGTRTLASSFLLPSNFPFSFCHSMKTSILRPLALLQALLHLTFPIINLDSKAQYTSVAFQSNVTCQDILSRGVIEDGHRREISSSSRPKT